MKKAYALIILILSFPNLMIFL